MAYQRKTWNHGEPLTQDVLNNLEARVEGGVDGAVYDARVYTDRETAKDRTRLSTLEARAAAEGKLIERIEDDNGDGMATVHYTNGLTEPLPLPAGPIGPAGQGAGLSRTPDSYLIPTGGTVAIPHTHITTSGSIFMSIDGNSPLPVWFQIYRSGTYNACKLIAGGGNAWTFGDTARPATGTWNLWIEGNGANALLMAGNRGSYPRRVRFYWLNL